MRPTSEFSRFRLHVELQRVIDDVEDKIERLTVQAQELQAFESTGGSTALEREIERLAQLAAQKKQEYDLQVQKIHNRHELSVATGHKKTQQILQELGSKANERGIKQMSEERMQIVGKNRKLKEQVQVLRKERDRLRDLVENLEQDSMRLSCNSTFSVDWNLRYDDELAVKYSPISMTESLPELPPISKGNTVNEIQNVDDLVSKIIYREEIRREEQVADFGIIGKKKYFK
jgi:hypothetical protein